jgi:hypothetical protein
LRGFGELRRVKITERHGPGVRSLEAIAQIAYALPAASDQAQSNGVVRTQHFPTRPINSCHTRRETGQKLAARRVKFILHRASFQLPESALQSLSGKFT